MKNKALLLENGRFNSLLSSCASFDELCFSCRYFDGKKDVSYRCYGYGSCPAASLNPKMIEYILLKLDA